MMTTAFPKLPLKPSLLPQNRENMPDPQLSYSESIPPMINAKMSHQWHSLSTSQYIFTKAHLENLLLSNLGDRGEMAHSIEGRTPFLDHHLTEYANSLPPTMKIRPVKKPLQSRSTEINNPVDQNSRAPTKAFDFIEKYVLREAARPFVTDEIYQKRKHPYTAPLQYAVDGPLHRLMKRLVTRENIERLGFLDWTSSFIQPHCARSLGQLVDIAFAEKHESIFRLVICIAQWVVLGQRFGVKKANSQ